MITHYVPEAGEHSGHACDLEDELKDLKHTNTLEVWYWYESGSYDGSGYLVGLTKTGEFFSAGLGHCSCCGPLDNFNPTSGLYKTPETFLEAHTYDNNKLSDEKLVKPAIERWYELFGGNKSVSLGRALLSERNEK